MNIQRHLKALMIIQEARQGLRKLHLVKEDLVRGMEIKTQGAESCKFKGKHEPLEYTALRALIEKFVHIYYNVRGIVLA